MLSDRTNVFNNRVIVLNNRATVLSDRDIVFSNRASVFNYHDIVYGDRISVLKYRIIVFSDRANVFGDRGIVHSFPDYAKELLIKIGMVEGYFVKYGAIFSLLDDEIQDRISVCNLRG